MRYADCEEVIVVAHNNCIQDVRRCGSGKYWRGGEKKKREGSWAPMQALGTEAYVLVGAK